MKYLPKPLHIVKDNLFEIPPIFKIIQENSGASFKEMYEVFNMGHRLEIFTNQAAANKMIAIANTLNIEAKIIGRVEAPINNQKKLTVKGSFGEINY
jgi:phosphoribosylformylglycinamidine cyclo-ligase